MATYYTDEFYAIDPYAPPAAGTVLDVQYLSVLDSNDNEVLNSTDSTGPWYNRTYDEINGSRITGVYNGDQVTVQDSDGVNHTIQGITFYTADGGRWFTPLSGTHLIDGATFVSSSWVPDDTDATVGAPGTDMGPPCFTAGTLIRTPDGLRRVETLQPGDLVTTLDHGPRPVRWIGQRRVEAEGRFAPILFDAGAIGNTRPLRVSPQHRMLVSGWQAELLFGQDEVLACAKHLVNGRSIIRAPRRWVSYVHLLFDRHEIVEAEGVPSESFHPGDYMLTGDDELRDEVMTLFPELANLSHASGWDAARTVLKAHEAQLLARAA